FGGAQPQQQQSSGGLFGQTTAQAKPFGTGTGLFGSGTSTVFGQTQAVATQPAFNLFSSQGMNTQAAKPGGFTFGGTGATVIGNTSQQQPVQIGTDQATLAAQQTLIQCHLKGLAQSPYGDSKLLQLLKGRQVQSPTGASGCVKSPSSFPDHSLFAGSFVASPTVLDIKPIPPARPSPRVLTMSINLNASQSRDKRLIAADLDNDRLTFSEGYVPKRNVKKLILGRTADKVKKDSGNSASFSTRLDISSANEAQNASIFDDR
uniref:Uncharacterized protein n=1 Tax=Romanomermis culicivorax TaxID=13658 RepID=A0A915J4V1_ROMCU